MTAAPAGGAWIDNNRYSDGTRYQSNCAGPGPWSQAASNAVGMIVDSNGSLITSQPCNVARPLACCIEPHTAQFAGYTPTSFTGSLGGWVGANAKCNAAFAGSSLCTIVDYNRADTNQAAPASGAWVDNNRYSDGTRYQSNCAATSPWTQAVSTAVGMIVNAQGMLLTSQPCNASRPLACCR